jgi:arginyl-tRNA synthetase
MNSIPNQISAAIVAILGESRDFLGCEIPDNISLDRPKNRDHGDYATSIALVLAKPAFQNLPLSPRSRLLVQVLLISRSLNLGRARD